MVFSHHQRAPLLPRLTPGQYRDPVCGMRTGEDGPIVTHDGETYYFYSAGCKRVFTNDPDNYSDVHPVAVPTGGLANDHD